MPVTVTIYNDDEHGHDIQVVQLNPFGESKPPKIMQPSTDARSSCEQFKLRNGELLIISTAERVTEKEPA